MLKSQRPHCISPFQQASTILQVPLHIQFNNADSLHVYCLQRWSTTFKTDKNDEAFNLTSVFQRGLSITELLSFDRNDGNTDVLPFFSKRVFFANMDPIILSTAYSVLKQHYINLKVNRGHAGACTVPARKAANETRRVRQILKE